MRCPVRDPENKSSIAVFYSRPIYAKIPLLCSWTNKHENCLSMIYIVLLRSRLRPTNPHNIHHRGWYPVRFNKLKSFFFFFSRLWCHKLHSLHVFTLCDKLFCQQPSVTICFQQECHQKSSVCPCPLLAVAQPNTSSPPNSLGLAVEKSLAVQRQNKVRVGLAVVSYPPRLPRVTAVLLNPL